MSQPRLQIAFVGHVDHGKSTLIGRLLTDTGSVAPGRVAELAAAGGGAEVELAHLLDQLREEREHAATMDTAQAVVRTATREFVAIDAPGHRAFLRHMLTGASQADEAVLVVDASEGVREQTRRHALLLTLLGLDRCVVAVNKMDLVGFAEAPYRQVVAALHEILDEIGLAVVAAVPVRARLGDQVVRPSERMAWHDGPPLLDVLANRPAVGRAARPLRFPVQDVYEVDGRRIAVGRVESGTLAAGADVMVLPDGVGARVASIERLGGGGAEAEPGECVGVTLLDAVALRRGMVLSDPHGAPSTVAALDARVFWLAEGPLRRGDAVTLRVCTQAAECRVATIRRCVHLNAWLAQNGFLAIDDASGAEGHALLRGIDWSRTRAYATGFTSLYLNLRGRERDGIVAPGDEAAALKREIAARLRQLRDPETGAPVVSQVFDAAELYAGPFLHQAPDLVVGYCPGYRASWQTALGGAGRAVVEANRGSWRGDHLVDPACVPGVLLASRRLADGPCHVRDMAPTLLHLLGLPRRPNVDGRSLRCQTSADDLG